MSLIERINEIVAIIERLSRKLDGIRGPGVTHTPTGITIAPPPRKTVTAAGGGDDAFYARVSGSTKDGTNFRWSYDFVEVVKTSAGFGTWNDMTGGRTGTLRNLLEDQNGAVGPDGQRREYRQPHRHVCPAADPHRYAGPGGSRRGDRRQPRVLDELRKRRRRGVLMSGCNSRKCCCGSGCYQRWTVRWNCGSPGFFDAVVAGAKTCFATPPVSGWNKYATTDDNCDYEIYLPLGSACGDDTDCASLPDTTPPDPFGCIDEDCTGPAVRLDHTGTLPVDCCCPCLCCPPDGTVLNVAVDGSGMTPTVPTGGWHTTPPVQPGDWHSYLGSNEWVAHPATIFRGGVNMPYNASGFGVGINCDTDPTTQPANQPAGAPTAPQPGTTLPCANIDGGYDYAIRLQCDGPDAGDTYTVTADGTSMDDVFDHLKGPYFYTGSVSGVALTCVNGRPTGTATIPMTWDSTDAAFNPDGGPRPCGSLVAVFS